MSADHSLTALLLDPFLTVGEAERESGARCRRVRGDGPRPATSPSAGPPQGPARRRAEPAGANGMGTGAGPVALGSPPA